MANYDMFSINAPWVCPFRETFHASQNSVPVVKRRKGCVPSKRSVADEIRCIFELFLWVWHAAIMSSPKLTGYKMCHRQNVMKRLQFAFAWKSFLHRCCYFFYVISLWAAVGGTETANLCNRYRHWDMQMMRWIFVVAATFLFHFFFSDKTERCRLYLNECRRFVLLPLPLLLARNLHKSNCEYSMNGVRQMFVVQVQGAGDLERAMGWHLKY